MSVRHGVLATVQPGRGLRPRPGRWQLLPLVLLLAAPVALAAVPAAAADISVGARIDPVRVRVGEAAELAVEVKGVQDAPAPAIAAAEGLTIHYVGPSTQISLVNMRMSASVTHRFSVTAGKPGTFTIGPISVEYGGKTYDAGSVSLAVVPAAATGRGGRARTAGAEALRLVLSASKQQVYLHERVPLRVKLYVGNVRASDVQYPTVAGDGFALEKFFEPAQYAEQTEQGAAQVLDFQSALVALRAGALAVGPAKLALNVLVRQRGRDAFFERFFGDDPFSTVRRPLEIESEPLELDVLPLPEAGKPADFSGAVGRFGFEVAAAPRELTAGDPVTVTMTIRGVGNLENVTAPAFAAADALRVYPPQQQTGQATSGAAANVQEKVFEQVVIPQHAGAVELPALTFSYFDPETRVYRTIVHPPVALDVRARAPGSAEPRVVGGAPGEQRAEALGRDIVFIKETPGRLVRRGARLYRSAVFWAFQPLPLLAYLAALLYDRRRRRLSGDVRYARFIGARREARRALAGARAALRGGEREAFYDAVARAVSDYLAAKLDLPPGAVTAETVADRLRGRGIDAPVADDLREFLAACERVRFAPAAAADGDMQHTLDRAAAIIRGFERQRRLAPPLAAIALLAGLAASGWAAGGESPQALFFRGNELYGAERYSEAATEYEKILATGFESGHLYFNLGNAYFKAGDSGRAILDYERARRLMPRDPDLHANLSYARTLAGGGEEPALHEKLLFPLASRLGGDEFVLAASAAYTLLMLLLIAARLLPATGRGARRGAAAVGIALAVLLSSGAFRLATVDLPTYAVVVAREDATVRFEPSAGATAHFEAGPGSVLRVLARREQWAQVARADGRRGWIEIAALEEI